MYKSVVCHSASLFVHRRFTCGDEVTVDLCEMHNIQSTKCPKSWSRGQVINTGHELRYKPTGLIEERRLHIGSLPSPRSLKQLQ